MGCAGNAGLVERHWHCARIKQERNLFSKFKGRKSFFRIPESLIRTGLVLAIGCIGLTSVPAIAADQAPPDPCESPLVDAVEARNIARSLMQERGWIQSRSTRVTLGIGTVFHIQKAACVDGQWRVTAVLKEHLTPDREMVVVINCQSGEIEDSKPAIVGSTHDDSYKVDDTAPAGVVNSRGVQSMAIKSGQKTILYAEKTLAKCKKRRRTGSNIRKSDCVAGGSYPITTGTYDEPLVTTVPRVRPNVPPGVPRSRND
jgi:hypothetical protein